MRMRAWLTPPHPISATMRLASLRRARSTTRTASSPSPRPTDATLIHPSSRGGGCPNEGVERSHGKGTPEIPGLGALHSFIWAKQGRSGRDGMRKQERLSETEDGLRDEEVDHEAARVDEGADERCGHDRRVDSRRTRP